MMTSYWIIFFFFQAEDGIRDLTVTGVQTCALPIYELVAEHVEAPRQHVGDRELQVHQGIEQSDLAEAPAAELAEAIEQRPQHDQRRSEEHRVGKECRSRWSPDH